MFYFAKKVRLFSQNDVLFLFYFLINPTMTTAFGISCHHKHTGIGEKKSCVIYLLRSTHVIYSHMVFFFYFHNICLGRILFLISSVIFVGWVIL